EILPDEKCRSVCDGNPEPCLIARSGKGRPVGAMYAEFLPFCIGTHRTALCEAEVGRLHRHLATPGFATAVAPAFDQITRRAGQRVVWFAEGSGTSVPVVVDPHVQPDF